jgi:DNA-binding NarL/FixJ family response regulator
MIEIAIYEDNKDLAQGLTLLFNAANDFKVIASFENCNDIENDLNKHKPDLILMDIEMPGTGGLEGLRRAKALLGNNIKVLMLTVFEDNDKIFDALRFGADGYILKKTPPSKIIEYINDAMEGGAPMTPSIARKVLNLFPSQAQKVEDSVSFKLLSGREKDVLNLIVDGHSYKMIAEQLFISVDTVRSHIKKIYEKLHVNSKSQAVAKVLRRQ